MITLARAKCMVQLTLIAALVGGSLGLVAYHAAADEDKPAPRADPPAKARALKSALPMYVHEIVDGEGLRTRGVTGTGQTKAVSIPAGAVWVVQPIGTFGGGFGGIVGGPGMVPGGASVRGGGLIGGAPVGGGIKGGGVIGGPRPPGGMPRMAGFGPHLTGDSLKALLAEMRKQSIPGLMIQNMTVSADDLAEIVAVPSLQSLLLDMGSGVNDEALARLQAARNLRLLSLNGVTVTDRGLESLARVPALAELRLSGPGITNQSMASLKGLKTLESLRLVNTHVEGEGLLELKSLPKLRRLELVGPFTDTDLKDLKELPHLEVVRLGNSAVTDDGIYDLANLKGLKVLTLDGHWALNGIRSPIGRTPDGKLQWALVGPPGMPAGGFVGGGFFGLAIGGGLNVPVPQFTGKPLEKLTGLNELHLLNMKLKDDDLEGVGRLTGLKKLTVFAPDIGDAGIAKLRGLTRLETIDLRGTQVTTKSVATLQKMPALKLFRSNAVTTDPRGKAALATWRSALPRTSVQGLDLTSGPMVPGAMGGVGGFGALGGP